MEELNLIFFVCVAIPMSMMLLIFKGNSRAICGFLIAGMFMGVFAGEINGFIHNINNFDVQFISVNIAPLVEEIAKAIPVIFIAFLTKPSEQRLAEYSLAMGVGFATLENICVLSNSIGVSLGYALLRAIGAGMMHGICTLTIGLVMKYVLERRILFFSGTLAALSTAVIYHSTFNMLITSKYMFVGVLLPTVTLVVILIINNIGRKKSEV